MRIFVVTSSIGMVMRAYSSGVLAKRYVNEHPGFTLDSVELSEDVDPSEELGPPDKVELDIKLSLTVQVVDLPPINHELPPEAGKLLTRSLMWAAVRLRSQPDELTILSHRVLDSAGRAVEVDQ